MTTRNKAWNLNQGDGLQYAKSSFTVGEGEYVKINAYYLCGSDKIIVLEIDNAPECTDFDNIAREYAVLDSENKSGTIGEAGRYILARECGKNEGEIFGLNAQVSVAKHQLIAGITPKPNSGFADA